MTLAQGAAPQETLRVLMIEIFFKFRGTELLLSCRFEQIDQLRWAQTELGLRSREDFE
jgi:hypothetical protein